MDIVRGLENELNLFWCWAGVKIEQFENREIDATLYPNWMEVMRLTEEAIDYIENTRNDNLIGSIMIVLGLDNEVENILDKLEKRLSSDVLKVFVSKSIDFPFYNTRWQIAELIGRRTECNLERYLVRFLDDENKYVQRRALLSLVKVNPDLAVKVSFEKLSDCDEMMRYVSLLTLHELSSELLEKAVYILKNDESSLVQGVLQEINKG
ncbi:hypothetical protein IC619_016365 [Hazenella sp. IB182353]|uniref:hypothetical protein n=1 Tax=Polycladospora coralii TaxID=2771432 RepID=UPI001746C4CB|nr:hypothetical protein [Polycladospora coralii]MBS7532021.1 hypothetical protein [Polycladospora coralii]